MHRLTNLDRFFAVILILIPLGAKGQFVGEHVSGVFASETIDVSNVYDVGDVLSIEIRYEVEPGTYRFPHDGTVHEYMVDISFMTPEVWAPSSLFTALRLEVPNGSAGGTFFRLGDDAHLELLAAGPVAMYLMVGQGGPQPPYTHLTDSRVVIMSYALTADPVAVEAMTFGEVKALFD
jgi:hypothetical protein